MTKYHNYRSIYTPSIAASNVGIPILIPYFINLTNENNHLKVTESGNDVLYGRRTISLNRFERQNFKAKRQEPPVEEPKVTDLGFSDVSNKVMDKALFEKLREVRKALAKANHIAPYMVFSDKSLQAMATEKPTTQAEFGILYGVGEVKCQKYWRPFTAAVREYLGIK